MKQLIKDLVTAVLLGLVLPGCLLNYAVLWMETRAAPGIQVIEEERPKQVSLKMRLRQGDQVTQMDMDQYLVGAVLGEMPAFFEEEALKAQAVAARTYARKAWATGGKHEDGSVCTDPSCCQAWLNPGEYIARGGSLEAIEKIRSSVESTSGYVLTYAGQLIEATYFSCSGGSTEDAVAVWGTDYPYLQSVESPGEEKAAHYEDRVVFSLREFQDKLGLFPEGTPESWFGTVLYTQGGGVSRMEIGGEVYTGQQLRTRLGLNSTAFTMEAEDDGIAITTRGHGHRVGMSQYGADAMAAAGSSYADILTHYYPGAVLTRLDNEEQGEN